MANKCGQMAHNMKVNGDSMQQMVSENLFIKTGMSMKACGETTKLMVKGLTFMLMAHNILVSGDTTSSMVKAKNHGQMEPDITETILKGRSMVKVL